MNLKGKRILIIQQRQWALGIGHALARNLQEQGCILAAMSIKPSTHDFLLRQKEVVYEEIVSGDDITNQAREYIAGRDVTLEMICEDLEVDSIWPLVQAVRSFVKCYRDKYQYGFRQNIDDESICVIVKAWYLLVRDMFERFRPDAVVAGVYVSLIHIFFNRYARKKGVASLAMTDCKFGDWCMASYSYLDDEGPVFDRFAQLQAGVDNPQRERARAEIAKVREKLVQIAPGRPIQQRGFLREMPSVGYRVAQSIWGILRNIGKDVPPSLVATDTPTPRLILRDYWQKHRNRHNSLNYPYHDFDKLENFAYFPLLTQPEMQIDVIAPRFNNLIEVARQVAMSLPGDTTLVVKDHPLMALEGLRAPGYLEKLARTPNVKLVDFRIPTRDILSRARLVVSPNSTTLTEAAYFRVPAIQLGDLGSTKMFPNVFVHSDLSTFSTAVRKALEADLTTPEYDRQLENYVSAVFDVGTPLAYGQIWYSGSDEDKRNVAEYFVAEIDRALSTLGAEKNQGIA